MITECPKCGKKLRVKGSSEEALPSNQKVKCQACDHVFVPKQEGSRLADGGKTGQSRPATDKGGVRDTELPYAQIKGVLGGILQSVSINRTGNIT